MTKVRTQKNIKKDGKDSSPEPLVSICCQTYNHQCFIRSTLNGFLMQKTTFPFEILIHDDASTDATAKIIADYVRHYPDIIKPIYQNDNQYSQGKKIAITYQYPRARGKYIALCEGDDYWTDPYKLQKQVDYLEANPDSSMCFHSVMIRTLNNILCPELQAANKYYSIDDLLLTKIAHTASFMFRRVHLNLALLANQFIFGGDVIISLMMAESGKVFGMKDCMAVYRIHKGGITSIVKATSGIEHEKRLLTQYRFVKKTFKSLSTKAAKVKIIDHCVTILKYYAKRNKLISLKYLLLAVYYDPLLMYKGLVKIISKGNRNY